MNIYMPHGSLADNIDDFAFRQTVYIEYEGDFDDLGYELRDIDTDRDEIVYLSFLSSIIEGHAFADTKSQVGWMIYPVRGDIYLMERHHLSEMVHDDRYRSGMRILGRSSDERDDLIDLTGELVRVASSTDGMDIYRATDADGDPASYWIKSGEGRVTRMLVHQAMEVVLVHADHMTVNASAGNVWSMLASMVSARQSYLEFDTDSVEGREFQCLEKMDIRRVIHSLTKE